MEEKILIQSKFDKRIKSNIKCVAFIFIGLAILLLIFTIASSITYYNEWRNYYKESWYNPSTKKYMIWIDGPRYDRVYKSFNSFDAAFHYRFTFKERLGQFLGYMYGDVNIPALVFDIIRWSFLLFAAIIAIFLWAYSKYQLIVTDKNIKGRGLFGKEVTLPINMVSAYSTRRWFSTIAITTASGCTVFHMIENYKEIGNTLQKLLNRRQDKTEIHDISSSTQHNSNNLDDLIKLKTLLDNGIITQEEFDAKKKQLLGL